MKKLYMTLMMLAFIAVAHAQHIAVKDFYYVENDLTARTQGTRVEDQNGYLCALIKVRTTEKGLWAFDVGMLGVTKTEMQNAAHPAEIWVYVPFGVTRMTIQHEKLGVVDRWPFPCSIEKGCTYLMELTTGKVETIIKEEVRMQYLAFQITPPNAVLTVNDELWEVGADGSAMKYVDFGDYTYRVQAPNYHTEVGKVTVDDPENTHRVIVNLKSDFVEVTLKVDADAEIWVNDEKKGTRSWTGALGKGSYKVECKQAGHETTLTTQKITADMEGQTITLPAPVPVYGSLGVESTPFAKLYIDGKAMGETPKFVKEILVGEHEVRLTKDGYADYTETITITKGERRQVTATLVADGSASVAQQPKRPKPQKKQPKEPESNAFFVMANAAYSIAPQFSTGITIGSVKRLGWYVSLGTNFNFSSESGFTCEGTGNWLNQFVGNYSFTGNKKTSRFSATAGMAVKIVDPVYAYAGLGYGYRNLFWEYVSGSVNAYAKNVDDSYKGLAIDGGLMLHFNGFGVSLGVQTIGVKYMEAKIGIGYTLKRK